MEEWVQLFTSQLDMAVMVAIGIVALVCIRARHITNDTAMLVSLALGGAWGVVEAYKAGYAPVAIVVKGALVNGAGAAVIALLVSKLWDTVFDRLVTVLSGGGSGGK